jgi:hypothetical protein
LWLAVVAVVLLQRQMATNELVALVLVDIENSHLKQLHLALLIQ